MLKSDSIIGSDVFNEAQMNNSIWDNSKVAMVVDASWVIGGRGCIASSMFEGLKDKLIWILDCLTQYI